MGGVGNNAYLEARKCVPLHTISVACNAVLLSHLPSLTTTTVNYDNDSYMTIVTKMTKNT